MTGPARWGKDGKAGKETRGETERGADGGSTVLALPKASRMGFASITLWCTPEPEPANIRKHTVPRGTPPPLALCSSASTATTARRANDTALLSDGCTHTQCEFIAVRACMCARVCVCAWCVYLCVRACVIVCARACRRTCARTTCARSDSQKLTRAPSVLRKAAWHGDPMRHDIPRRHGHPGHMGYRIS